MQAYNHSDNTKWNGTDYHSHFSKGIELNDKQKEFQHEKQELQKVIEEMCGQIISKCGRNLREMMLWCRGQAKWTNGMEVDEEADAPTNDTIAHYIGEAPDIVVNEPAPEDEPAAAVDVTAPPSAFPAEGPGIDEWLEFMTN